MARRIRVDTYKFIGDAWVLLLDTSTPPEQILIGIRDLCKVYEREFDRLLAPVLTTRPERTGIAFGISSGVLFKTTVFQTTEYLARALNVATRLQIHAKELTSRFAVMCAADTYGKYFISVDGFRAIQTTVALKGLRDGYDFPCVAIDLM